MPVETNLYLIVLKKKRKLCMSSKHVAIPKIFSKELLPTFSHLATVKIETYPLSLKVSRKALALLK